MAAEPGASTVDEGMEETAGYKPPAEKSLEEMMKQDQEDESLEKYKRQLIGEAGDKVFFPEDPRRVIVTKLTLMVDGREDVDLDLTGDLSKLKSESFTIKEGSAFKMKISFYVQRDIVTGLMYIQKTYRKSIKFDSTKMMVGSYGPKAELQSYITPVSEAPSGLVARGHYTVGSLFTDDDKHEYLKWDWSFDIKKEWK